MASIEDISNSLGYAVVHGMSGNIVKSGGDLENDDVTIGKLYSIFVDSIRTIGDDSMHRVSVTFGTFSYVLTMGEGNGEKHVYILKAPSLGN